MPAGVHLFAMTPEQRKAQRAPELDARRTPTVADAVGLALRDHRRRLRLSQRAYAAVRGRPHRTIARLESSAGGFCLDDVTEALRGTGFALALVRPGDVLDHAAAATVVTASSWPVTELLARVRAGSRHVA